MKDLPKKAFIIGGSVEQYSLSPKMHGFWLKELNIEGSYTAFNVKPEELKAKIELLKNEKYVGGNVTLPHKEAVMEFCEIDQSISSATKIGAINTLVLRDGKFIGSNTDYYGFGQSFENKADIASVKRALVLGAGGASRAVILELTLRNYEITITNRSNERAENLAKEFGCKVIEWEKRNDLAGYDLLVNTTSLGMKNEPELEIDLSSLPKTAIVYDIVYNPLKTRLLEQAETLGLQTIGGLWMLIYQGVPGFELWFGKTPKPSQKLYDFLASQIK